MRSEKLIEKASKVIKAYEELKLAEPITELDRPIFKDVDERFEIYKQQPFLPTIMMCDKQRGKVVFGWFDNGCTYDALGFLIGKYLDLTKEDA